MSTRKTSDQTASRDSVLPTLGVYLWCISDEDQSHVSRSDASLGDIVAAEQLVRTAQEERSVHLPIGNLLITAGRDGQVFHVTATGVFR